MTMATFALRLARRVGRGVPGVFMLLSKKDLEKPGLSSFSQLQQYWHSHKVLFDDTCQPRPRMVSGIHFLSDPETSEGVLAVMAAGEASLEALAALKGGSCEGVFG